MSIPKLLYDNVPCTVLAALENAIVLCRQSGAQFTVPINDPLLTIQQDPHEVGIAPLHEAGQPP